MLYNPYETTYLRSKRQEELEMELNKFFVMYKPETLSYEFRNNEMNLVFITGKNDDEKLLPIINQPYFIEYKHDDYIIIDVRRLVKYDYDKNFLDVNDIIKDKITFLHQVTKAMYSEYAKTEPAKLQRLVNPTSYAYTSWLVGSIMRKYGLSPTEKQNVNIVICQYIVNKFINPDNDKYEAREVIERVNQVLNLKLTNNIKEYIINSINTTPDTIEDLIENIITLTESKKLLNLNKTVLYDAIGQSWFGQNGLEEALVALEHIPTVIAMTNTVLISSFYRKTFFGQMVDANKRYIDSNHYKLTIKSHIEEIGRYPDL